MEQTRKMLSSIIISDDLRNLTNEELVKEYKKEQNDEILAIFYTKNYKLLCQHTKIYYTISTEDKASIVLQTISKTMLSYNLTLSKYTTYFVNILHNELRTYITYQLRDKRAVGNKTKSISSGALEYYQLLTVEDDYDLLHILLDNNYTKLEKTYIAGILNNCTCADLSRMTKIPQWQFWNVRKQLLKKIIKKN